MDSTRTAYLVLGMAGLHAVRLCRRHPLDARRLMGAIRRETQDLPAESRHDSKTAGEAMKDPEVREAIAAVLVPRPLIDGPDWHPHVDRIARALGPDHDPEDVEDALYYLRGAWLDLDNEADER